MPLNTHSYLLNDDIVDPCKDVYGLLLVPASGHFLIIGLWKPNVQSDVGESWDNNLVGGIAEA